MKSFRKLIPVALLLAAACGGNSSGGGGTPAPTITQPPADATAAAGGTATFTVTASGTGLAYQWSRNGSQISGATGASYTTPALAAADDGSSFTVAVSDSGGSVTSPAATLHVNWVRIDTQPVDTGATSGGPANITLAASGSGTLSYQWKKAGTALAGVTSANFHLNLTLSTDAGAYTCVVTSTLGGTTALVETNPANLVVMTAPQIGAQPQSSTVAAGAQATFSVNATGADPLSYQWQKAGVNIPSATLATFTIPSAAAGDAASYRVVVTGTHGTFTSSTTSAPATLTVVVPPTLAALGDKLIAEGGAGFTLTASATPAAGMPTAIAYQWQKDGANIPGATFPAFTLPHVMGQADVGLYTIVASTTVNGVAASGTVSSNVQMLAKPVITAITPNPAQVDQGASFTVTVTATGTPVLSYQWMLNGNPVANGTSATYSVTSANATDAGDYVCVVTSTSQGVTASASSPAATVTVIAPPQITKQPQNLTVPETQTGTFTVVVAGSGLTYQWYRNGAPISGATSASYTTDPVGLADQGATFSCTISSAFPDLTSGTATLTVGPPPSQFDSSVSSLVLGEGAILRWNFIGTATLQQGTATPAAVASGQSLVVYPNVTTTYTLTITNDFTQTLPLTVSVKTYIPKNLYVLNTYASGQTPQPPDSIAHYTINVVHQAPPNADVYLPSGASSGAKPAGALTPTGAFPIHVVASPDASQSHLYVANNGDSTISAFAVGAGGVLAAVAGSPFLITNDSNPFASAIDPSGAHLYVGCAGGVRVFTIDSSTGALTAALTLDRPIPGRVEGDVLMHPSGRWLYVADHGNDAIQVYAVDAASGALTKVAAAPSPGGPTGLTFDRAGARLFSRGTDSTPTFNAQIHVFAVDAFSGALSETSTYHGYGPNALLDLSFPGAQMPFVPGVDAHLHGLAYSKRPDVDALYNAYSLDNSIPGANSPGYSLSSLDVSPSGITADRTEGNLGSPFFIDVLNRTSQGGSVFADRSGSVVVLTGWNSSFNLGECAYYPTDPVTGVMQGINGGSFNQEYSLVAGAPTSHNIQTHGLFTGQLQ
jgi:hypothetical protein